MGADLVQRLGHCEAGGIQETLANAREEGAFRKHDGPRYGRKVLLLFFKGKSLADVDFFFYS